MADAALDGLRDRCPFRELFPISTDEEETVIGAGAIEHHNREDLADIDQVNAGNQSHERQSLDGHPNRHADGDQGNESQQGRAIDQ